MRFDDSLILRLGLDPLSPDDRAAFLDAFRRDLERNVGAQLCARMSDLEIETFADAIAGGDEEVAFDVLRAEVPELRLVVRTEFDRLCDAVRARAGEILDAAR